MSISSKSKFLLLLIGTSVGVGFGAAIGYTVKHFVKPSLPAGASFENVDEFRRVMTEHDERDQQIDGSLSLRSIIQPDPSDLVIYRLRPNLNVTFQGVPLVTNSWGLRGPEISQDKPTGTFRVALLGDSFAFGWGVEQKDIFAQVAENELNRITQGKPKVEVLNFGVPGYSTFQEVALFENFGQQFQPDAVVVYFVDNDFGLPFYIKNFEENSDELVSNQQFSGMHERAKEAGEADRHRALLKNLNANRVLRRLAESCKEKSLPLFLVINPKRNWEKELRKLWVLNHVDNIKLLNIRADLKKIIEKENLTGKDLRLANDPHPNARKHKMLGELIALHLAAALKFSENE